MKIRQGFVSNSSTSSFICCVCGRTETGMDISLRDCEMCECINGHTFCTEEAMDDLPEEAYYEAPEKCCPVCTFQSGSNRDLKRLLLKETKCTLEDAFTEVKKSNKRRRVLKDEEYVMYACLKSGIDRATLVPSIKERFGTYGKFLEYLQTK